MKTSLIGELSRLKGARAPELKGTMCDLMRYRKAGDRVRIRFVSTCTRYASLSLARAIVSNLLVLTWDESGPVESRRSREVQWRADSDEMIDSMMY